MPRKKRSKRAKTETKKTSKTTAASKKEERVKIIKRDGRIEEYVFEKIVVSIVKTGAPVDIARKIAKEVEEKVIKGRKEVDTKKIKKAVLDKLKKENKEWYENWLLYDKAVKKRVE